MKRKATSFVKALPAQLVETGIHWEVYCVDCDSCLGTMRSSTLQSAVMMNLGRGGIKCPDCRKLSCEGCGDNGILSRGLSHPKYRVEGLSKPARLCFLCVDELKAEVRKVDLLATKELDRNGAV